MALAEEVVSRVDAGEGEEVTAADGADVLLERLTREALLDCHEPGFEVALEADEQEALVEQARIIETAAVGVPATA